jgi:hypothetical protein
LANFYHNNHIDSSLFARTANPLAAWKRDCNYNADCNSNANANCNVNANCNPNDDCHPNDD